MVTPVILLPGSLCDERLFAHLLPALGGRCRVADLSLDDSIEAMARRVLDAAPPRFAVLGLSLGGIVAAEIAIIAPERIVGMALIDTNLDAPDEAHLRTRGRWAGDVRAGHFARLVEEFVPTLTVSPEIHGPLIVEMAMSIGPAAFLRQNDALSDRPDRRPVVSTMQCPTLIACGRDDYLCPPELHHDLATSAPHARLAVIAQAGHLSTIDQPAALTGAISEWLKLCNKYQTRRETSHECTTA